VAAQIGIAKIAEIAKQSKLIVWQFAAVLAIKKPARTRKCEIDGRVSGFNSLAILAFLAIGS
jgi:hypothetical protein